MKVLIVLPHYFDVRGDASFATHGSLATNARDRRVAVVRQTFACLHQTFGPGQSMLHIADRRIVAANQSVSDQVHLIAVTRGDDHLLDDATIGNDVERVSVDGDPQELGFAAHEILRDRFGDFDFVGYLEDDLWIRDAAWFQKLAWFNDNTDELSLLLPHRYEVRARTGPSSVRKLYIDGDLAPHVTASFQNITDRPDWKGQVMGRPVRWTRTLNPHSGCFFLSRRQAQRWFAQSHFADRDRSFVGPLESAATLSIARTFRVYKPAPENAAFLELEHGDRRFIHLVR